MTDAGGEVRLQQLRGSRRQVLVFTDLAERRDYRWQMATLAAAREGLASRDVAVLEVHGDSLGSLDGSPLSADEVRQLREEHRVGPGAFLVVLVGRDGAEKFRSNARACCPALRPHRREAPGSPGAAGAASPLRPAEGAGRRTPSLPRAPCTRRPPVGPCSADGHGAHERPALPGEVRP